MKKLLPILILTVMCTGNYAQVPLPFKSLRYDEDYTGLKNDSNPSWYSKIKYLSLSKNKEFYASFGGDIRYQYFNIKNEDWGDAGLDAYGYVLSRFLMHADIHAAPLVRTFIQLQSSLVNGKPVTSAIDENPLELHQAFVDVNLLSKIKWQFRIGRQELLYGSQRLVAVREGPNNRHSFDAVKTMAVVGRYKMDLFYSHYVRGKKGLFNDGFNKDDKFWGAYVARNKLPFFNNIDCYYLGLWKRHTVFDDAAGTELRHSIGSRIWGNFNAVKYDVEAVYQFGTVAENSIRAWTLSFNSSYPFRKAFLQPEIGIKTEFISGDAAFNDGKLQTFNPLFPRGAYFGLASLIGPANLFDIHPSLSLSLQKNVLLTVDADLFWRYSNRDGIYTPGVSIIYSGRNSQAKFIGKQLAADIVFTPNNFLYFRAECTFFNAGKFLREAGAGRDILFWGITSQLKF